MKAPRQPLDLGTPELHKHRKALPEMASDGPYFRLRIMDGCEMDRLLMAERISADEYCTLERLASDLFRACLTGLRAQSYEPHVSGGDNQNLSESAATKRVRVNEIICHLDSEVGERIRKLVVGVAGDEVEIKPSNDPSLHRGIEALFGYYED